MSVLQTRRQSSNHRWAADAIMRTRGPSICERNAHLNNETGNKCCQRHLLKQADSPAKYRRPDHLKMDIQDEEWQQILAGLVTPVEFDFNAAEWDLDGPVAQSDRPMEPSQITNPTNCTGALGPTSPTKSCQASVCPPKFAPESMPVANMLSDPSQHEQQALPGKASESPDISILMSRIHNLEAK